MEIVQLKDLIFLIQKGHSLAAAASQVSPKMLPEEVLEFLQRPDQEVWMRAYKIAQNEALYAVEQGYLGIHSNTRNYQAELAARAPSDWKFRNSAPASRDSGRKTENFPPMRFNPPAQFFPNLVENDFD